MLGELLGALYSSQYGRALLRHQTISTSRTTNAAMAMPTATMTTSAQMSAVTTRLSSPAGFGMEGEVRVSLHPLGEACPALASPDRTHLRHSGERRADAPQERRPFVRRKYRGRPSGQAMRLTNLPRCTGPRWSGTSSLITVRVLTYGRR